MQLPGSADARFVEIGAGDEHQQDLWVKVLDHSRGAFTIDVWEALPWWQQRAYLEGWIRRDRQREEAAAAQAPGGGAAPAPGSTAPESTGGGTKLKDSPLWAARGDAPPPPPRMGPPRAEPSSAP